MARWRSRQSGWAGTMPRSRQMSAITSPIGRRRISSAICSAVGMCPSAGCGRGRGSVSLRRVRPGRGVETGGAAMQPRLEGGGAQQAAGDAGEDQGNVGGAEQTAMDSGVIAEAALAKGGGEEGAVGDELVDELEQAAGAAGLGGWGGWRGRHGGSKAQRGRLCQGIFSHMSFS